MDHVIVRKLEHLTGSAAAPTIAYAIEIRDRPGPAHKHGAFEDDLVWIQLHGGLMIAKARIDLCWIGEYGAISEIRARTKGAPIHDIEDYWKGRPRFGYAAVAGLKHEAWIDPHWAGPRSYGYEWITLENDKKRATWLDPKEASRTSSDLLARFKAWRG